MGVVVDWSGGWGKHGIKALVLDDFGLGLFFDPFGIWRRFEIVVGEREGEFGSGWFVGVGVELGTDSGFLWMNKECGFGEGGGLVVGVDGKDKGGDQYQ